MENLKIQFLDYLEMITRFICDSICQRVFSRSSSKSSESEAQTDPTFLKSQIRTNELVRSNLEKFKTGEGCATASSSPATH